MEVTIRPLRKEDAYISVKWRNDPDVFRYTGFVHNKEILIEDELKWIEIVLNNEDEYRCAILVDNEYIGNVYLTNIDGKEANYHIFIGEKEYWGKGIAKQASLLILDYAFHELKLDRVVLRVKEQNERALHLYQSIGFKSIEEDDIWITMQIRSNEFMVL